MQNATNIEENYSDLDLFKDSYKVHNEFRKSGQFTDLVLKTHDGREFPVHRNVIASGCSYFRAMFNVESNWAEINQNVIELREEITSECLELILEYLYTGQIRITSANALILHQGAVHFQLNNLKKGVAQFPITDISMTTVLDLWRHGVKFYNADLEEKCLEFISNNLNDFFKDFLAKLNADELIKITTDSRLKLTQEKLYQYLISWMKLDFAARQKHLKDFIKLIRFNEISTEFQVNRILTDKILNRNDDFSSLIANSSLKLLLISSNCIYKIDLEKNIVWPVLKDYNISGRLCTFENSKKLLLSYQTKNDILKNNISRNRVYCPISNQIKYFPSSDYWNSTKCAVSQNDRIYFGKGSSKTIAYFDLNVGTWFKGPTLNKLENFDLIVGRDDCIYAIGGGLNEKITPYGFGGTINTTILSNDTIEKLDPRENKWTIILDNPVDVEFKFVRAIFYKEKIFCFYSNGGKIFDINKKSYVGNIKEAPVKLNNFDVANINEDCYVIGGAVINKCSENIGLKYNLESNEWTTLNINFPLGLDFCIGMNNYLISINVPMIFDSIKLRLHDFDI